MKVMSSKRVGFRGMKPKNRTKYAPGVEPPGNEKPRWSSTGESMYADLKFEQEFNKSKAVTPVGRKLDAYKATQAWLKGSPTVWQTVVGAGSNRPQDPSRWKPVR
jgi:hypothetical protein